MTTGTLARRIEKAAAQVRAGGGSGCAVCAAWPPVKWLNDPMGRGDSYPVRCPACRRARQVVEFVSNWRNPA